MHHVGWMLAGNAKAMSKKPKKQGSLFKAWGAGKSSKGKDRADPGPSVGHEAEDRSRDLPPAGHAAEEEEFGFEDFDFLEDELTEAELIQACEVPIPSEEATGGGPSTSSDSRPKPLKQSTIPFHIGPSAATHSILNCSVIEENIPSFDPEAGEMWLYPTNYPVRDYQFNIVKKALFINTLVCLPTGLGKTFIAAVVMYNFYRWYPIGKIVFLAPTKPLVAQQIEACHNVMGIPQGDVAEMTGLFVSLFMHEFVYIECTFRLSFVGRFVLFRSALYQRFYCTVKPPNNGYTWDPAFCPL